MKQNKPTASAPRAWEAIGASEFLMREEAVLDYPVTRVRAGLPLQELDALREALEMPLEQLAQKLGLSRATLHRRKADGRLALDESDRVMRFARLLGLATEVFGGLEEARAWLKAPQMALAGETPLDFARTEVGAREVEKLLGRIEYGVYS